MTTDAIPVVQTVNAGGSGPFVIVCDHASNRIPDPYGDLGLTPAQRQMHVAWDPGALNVSRELVRLLDAPLVHSTVSRLVIDCNRTYDAPDLIPVVSERVAIAANHDIGEDERRHRFERFHTPFHNAIRAVLDARRAAGRETVLVAMHSFTPVYLDVARPWPIGLIHGRDVRYTAALRDALQQEQGTMPVGWNEPYAALNGVTYTLEHHGDGRDLQSTMIEIRHDGILSPEGVLRWADILARTLEAARLALHARAVAATRQAG